MLVTAPNWLLPVNSRSSSPIPSQAWLWRSSTLLLPSIFLWLCLVQGKIAGMTEERRAVVLVGGVLAWTTIFVGVRIMLGHKRSYDFCNRVVSLLHVAVALLLCSMSVDNWWHPFHPLAAHSSPQQLRAITISLSYFIYDFFCCLLETPTDVATALHHLLSILGLAYGFAHASSGTELVACLWLEISNPFMHARELLKELGAKDSTVAVVNDACFALIFLVARLGVGPYLTFITLQANNPVTVKVGAAGIQIVSMFFGLTR